MSGEREVQPLVHVQGVTVRFGPLVANDAVEAMREANDRGFECLLLADCTGATDVGNYEAALEMVKMQGGVFGAVAHSDALIDCLGMA